MVLVFSRGKVIVWGDRAGNNFNSVEQRLLVHGLQVLSSEKRRVIVVRARKYIYKSWFVNQYVRRKPSRNLGAGLTTDSCVSDYPKRMTKPDVAPIYKPL